MLKELLNGISMEETPERVAGSTNRTSKEIIGKLDTGAPIDTNLAKLSSAKEVEAAVGAIITA